MKYLLLLLALAGCKGEKVSFNTAEESRVQARENSKELAQVFRAENGYADWTLTLRGDSTITQECPQGDGWASIDLRKGPETIKLKCSTVSAGIGCMTAKDFKSKSYAREDGSCNKDVPFPLPKIKI